MTRVAYSVCLLSLSVLASCGFKRTSQQGAGPVPTVALPVDSPVRGKASACEAVDARLKPRNQAECDPGAYQTL